MSKNIIICCDGTGNQFGEENSNVVKLFSFLNKQTKEQVAFYDPGVGTMSDPGLNVPFGKNISILMGLVFGSGLSKNIHEAYSYLMENYEEGDKVYLFGFSRGAFTVKVLAGFIHMNGLLPRGCQNLIPYSWQLYQRKNFELSARFKHNYAKPMPVHFMGVWDAVSSIGWITRRKTFPHTYYNPSVTTTRHAVSIDERRAYYEANLFDEGERVKDIKQVWFTGVHSDIGGSYPEAESGLSKITLQWMTGEAVKCGLKINGERFKKVVLGEGKTSYVGPDPFAPIHRSLNSFWWILEILPKNDVLNRKKFRFNLGKRRPVPGNSKIHQSVLQRIERSNYKPSNLPANYQVEE